MSPVLLFLNATHLIHEEISHCSYKSKTQTCIANFLLLLYTLYYPWTVGNNLLGEDQICHESVSFCSEERRVWDPTWNLLIECCMLCGCCCETLGRPRDRLAWLMYRWTRWPRYTCTTDKCQLKCGNTVAKINELRHESMIYMFILYGSLVYI